MEKIKLNPVHKEFLAGAEIAIDLKGLDTELPGRVFLWVAYKPRPRAAAKPSVDFTMRRGTVASIGGPNKEVKFTPRLAGLYTAILVGSHKGKPVTYRGVTVRVTRT